MTDLSLEPLRLRLDQEVVECPSYVHGFEALPDDSCPECKGSMNIPNPAYNGLREVFRERCVCRRGAHTEYIHQRCKGTGYITRSWEGMPGWWLASILMGAAFRSKLAIRSVSTDTLFTDPNAALAAVLEAMKEAR